MAAAPVKIRSAPNKSAASSDSSVRPPPRSYDRAARVRYGRIPKPTCHGRQLRAAARMLALTGPSSGDGAQLADLVAKLAAPAVAVVELREAQQHAPQAAAARAAAVRLREHCGQAGPAMAWYARVASPPSDFSCPQPRKYASRVRGESWRGGRAGCVAPAPAAGGSAEPPGEAMSCGWGTSADVGAALGNGVDQAFVAQQGDGTAGGGTGDFPGLDHLRFGGDAGAWGVLAGGDPGPDDGRDLLVRGDRAGRVDLGHWTRLADQARYPMLRYESIRVG